MIKDIQQGILYYEPSASDSVRDALALVINQYVNKFASFPTHAHMIPEMAKRLRQEPDPNVLGITVVEDTHWQNNQFWLGAHNMEVEYQRKR